MLKQQDYKGLDNITLIQNEQYIKGCKERYTANIVQAKHQIDKMKAVIKENEEQLKIADRELAKIADAMKCATTRQGGIV